MHLRRNRDLLRIATITAALISTFTASAALAQLQPPAVLWQKHRVALLDTPCEPGGDIDPEHCRAIALKDSAGTRVLGTHYMQVRLLWRGEGRGGSPDILVFGDDGGSGGLGDLIAVTASKTPVITKYSSERLDSVRPMPRTDDLRIDLPFEIGYFNGAPHAGVTIVPIPTRWSAGNIEPDLAALVRPSISNQELNFRELAMREELHAWAEAYYPTSRLYPPEAPSGTPVTVQALADLMLTGHADEARAMLAAAWPTSWNRTDVKLGGEKEFWKAMCRAVVRHPLWTRFRLDRLPNANVILAGAS
jgi:hypothetical protein